MTPKEFLKGKKVLVMGLGVFGGGAASAKWLFGQGALVTVTDMKSAQELEASFKKFTPLEKKHITFILGEHREKDFLENNVIVVNPGVPKESRFLDMARKAGKQIENDASFFYRFIQNPTIGVTGTRGKTTVTAWVSAFLSAKYKDVMPSGNTPENALLRELTRLPVARFNLATTGSEVKPRLIPAVSELSSWQLEILPASEKAPRVAIITNVFPDHLNRYKDIEEYARAKANIFTHQTSDDFLILNAANEWTPFFLAQKPKAQVFFFSKKALAKNKNGVFAKDGALIFRCDEKERKIADVKNFSERMGEHNLENLLAAVLAVTLFDPKLAITKKMIEGLPQIPFRQEIIFSKNGLTVVNDSAGTSPDAVVAALRRFKNTVLITGGTDKKLEFAELAKEIKKTLKPEHLVLLNGSATAKLITELEKLKFFKKQKPLVFETLNECIQAALQALPKQKGALVFSPGAASFEKFRNEFHRGEQFASLFFAQLGSQK